MEDVAVVRLGVTSGRRDTGHRRPRKGGGNHVDDRLQRLEVDLDQCRRVRGCCFGIRDDECHGLPHENDLGTGERLEPALRPMPLRLQVRRSQHGHDARDIERRPHADPPDHGVRIQARDDTGVEEAGQAQVAPVPGRAEHLVAGVDAWTTDPDVSRRLGHDGGLLVGTLYRAGGLDKRRGGSRRSRFAAVPVKGPSQGRTFCHASRSSITSAEPTTLTQPTHDLHAGAAWLRQHRSSYQPSGEAKGFVRAFGENP